MRLTIDIPIESIADPRGYTPPQIDFRPPPAVSRLLAAIVQPLLDAKAIPNIGNAHTAAAVWLLRQLAEAATTAEGAECARARVDRASPETAGPAEPARARDYYDRQAKERQKAAGERFHKGSPKVPVNLPEPSKGDARDQAAGGIVGNGGSRAGIATNAEEVPIGASGEATRFPRMTLVPQEDIAAREPPREIPGPVGGRVDPPTTGEQVPPHHAADPLELDPVNLHQASVRSGQGTLELLDHGVHVVGHVRSFLVGLSGQRNDSAV